MPSSVGSLNVCSRTDERAQTFNVEELTRSVHGRLPRPAVSRLETEASASKLLNCFGRACKHRGANRINPEHGRSIPATPTALSFLSRHHSRVHMRFAASTRNEKIVRK
jgi:hypothetical protein